MIFYICTWLTLDLNYSGQNASSEKLQVLRENYDSMICGTRSVHRRRHAMRYDRKHFDSNAWACNRGNRTHVLTESIEIPAVSVMYREKWFCYNISSGPADPSVEESGNGAWKKMLGLNIRAVTHRSLCRSDFLMNLPTAKCEDNGRMNVGHLYYLHSNSTLRNVLLQGAHGAGNSKETHSKIFGSNCSAARHLLLTASRTSGFAADHSWDRSFDY